MNRLIAIAGVVALLGACSVPKVMVHETFLPAHTKVVRETLKPVGTQGSKSNQKTLSNYYIQICDVAGADATNCKTTLVLENVTNYMVKGGVVQ